jgi:hypothetical protein
MAAIKMAEFWQLYFNPLNPADLRATIEETAAAAPTI